MWRRYLRFWGPDVRRDVDDELALHIEMLVEENIAAGMSADAARAAAERRFGDYTAFEHECLHIGEERERMIRRAERFSALGQDMKHVARTVVKSPGFALTTIFVLALGLGANAAIFSVVNSVVLRPLGYAEPDRLVQVYETFPMSGGGSGSGSVSIPNYEDWRAEARSFEALAISGYPQSVTLQTGEGTERLTAVPVGSGIFPMLGVEPLVGRYIAEGEDAAAAEPVVVLSEQAWRARFGADPGIVGSTLTLDGQAHTVVGLMPAEFRFPAGAGPRDIWIPLRASEQQRQNRGSHGFMVLGRLAPGVAPEAAETEMRGIAARIAEAYPDQQEGRSVEIVPLHEVVVGRVQPMMMVLLGAAGLLLLIACANAASLLLARAMARRREVAIRTALGASRGRVVRQFLAESLTLAGLGGALGLFLAWASLRWISTAAGPLLPRASEISVDLRVLGFLLGITLLTGALYGMIPALQTARSDLQAELREGGRQGSGGRRASTFRSTLVVTQIALSIVLLIGAGLLMRTFVALMATETGIATDRVLTMKLALPGGEYEDAAATADRFYVPMLERVRAVPGVSQAGLINLLPLEEWGFNGNFGIAGKTYQSAAEQPFAEIRLASPGYFEAMGIPILRGRALSPQDDRDSPPVVVINEALAERYFPGEDPVGQHITDFGPEPIEIVGVAAAVRQGRLTDQPMPELYFPFMQVPWVIPEMSLVVGTSLEPMSLAGPIRSAIREIDPQQPIFDVRPMSAVVAESVSDRRLYLWLLGVFAAVALALAITGMYGLIAYSVAQRTREFGIRLALGAGRERVSGMVVRQGAKLALAGLAVGIPAAYFLTRVLASLLYGVGTGDLVTYAAVAGILLAVAIAASWVPASRATRVDPIVTLRAE